MQSGIHAHWEEWHRGASREKKGSPWENSFPFIPVWKSFVILTKAGDQIAFVMMTDIYIFIKNFKGKVKVLKFQASKCQEDPMNKSHCEIYQHSLDICKISLLAMVPRDR